MTYTDKKTTAAGDLGASIAGLLRQTLMQTEGMLPAQVVSVDRASGRCDVKPMVMAGTVDGQKVARPIVPNVPIMCLGAGGIYASYPVRPGDLGFIFAADRDTSLFYQSEGGEDWPNTERLHDFGDGGFLPLRLFDFSIAGGVLSSGFCLQNEGGDTFITLKDGEVQIKAASVKIVGDITHTGSQVTSNMITATIGITAGNFTGLGGDSLTSTADIVSNGVSLQNHTHGGVQTGGGSTGKPN